MAATTTHETSSTSKINRLWLVRRGDSHVYTIPIDHEPCQRTGGMSWVRNCSPFAEFVFCGVSCIVRGSRHVSIQTTDICEHNCHWSWPHRHCVSRRPSA